MHPLKIFVPIILTSLLYFTPHAHADSEDPPDINIDINLQGVIDAIANLGSSLQGAITSIPSAVSSIFANAFKGSIINFSDPVLSLSQTLLTKNPDPTGLKPWWNSIVVVISSFYLLLFLFIGFMFLFSSLNPEKRVSAKEWLKNAFMIIILVNLSFTLYQVILELANAITQYMWLTGFENFFDKNIYNSSGAITLVVYGIAVFLTSLTLFIRHVFLLIGVVLFPIGIFLYYIPPLQGWGKMIFNVLGIYLFMQFIDVVIFVASNQAMNDLAGSQGISIVPALSFLIIFIVNVLLIFYAGIKAMFSITENSKVLGFAIGSLTGQVSGLITTIKSIPQNKTVYK